MLKRMPGVAWASLTVDDLVAGTLPTANGCLNLVIVAEPSAVAGDGMEFVLQYYNQSETDFTGGSLTFTIPAGMSVTDADAGTLSGDGKTVTWAGLTVPGGTSAEGGGAEQRVTVKVDAGVSNGTESVSYTHLRAHET